MDAAQVSERLRVAKRTLTRMTKDGRFPTPHGKGKMLRWLDQEVDAYMIFFTKSTQPIPVLDEARLAEIKTCADKAAKE